MNIATVPLILFIKKHNGYITAALLQVGLVCAKFRRSGLISFHFQPDVTLWSWRRPNSLHFLISAAPAVVNSTCCCCLMTVLLCAIKATVEWRFVCIGVALGNSLFTLCVFVVDSQPTHVSTLSVSAGSSGSALSHSA